MGVNTGYGKVICPKCGLDNTSEKVVYHGGDFAYCKNCKSTFSRVLLKNTPEIKKDDPEFIKCPDCNFPAYRTSRKKTYNCQKCKSAFIDETMAESKFVKCNNCGLEMFLKDEAESTCIRCGNVVNSHEKKIVLPDYKIDDTKASKKLKPKKAAYFAVTIATIVALILLAIVIIEGIWANGSNSTSVEKGQSNNGSPLVSSNIHL